MCYTIVTGDRISGFLNTESESFRKDVFVSQNGKHILLCFSRKKPGSRMNITIVGRKVNLRENFKVLVKRKLAKFDRIFDTDADATVTVTLEKNHQTVEITIKQRGMIYRAEASAPEMNEALDDVVAALGKQIRRNKTRLERAKKVQPIDLSDAYYDEPDEEIEIAKRKSFYVKTMTVEEAILQMNLLGHSFFLFRDDASGEINVVYKRNDGKYGVLEPET